jgi:hypothetical protein
MSGSDYDNYSSIGGVFLILMLIAGIGVGVWFFLLVCILPFVAMLESDEIPQKYVYYSEDEKAVQKEKQLKNYYDKCAKYKKDMEYYERRIEHLPQDREQYNKDWEEWKRAYSSYVNKSVMQNLCNVSSIKYQATSSIIREGSSESLLFTALEKLYPQYIKIDTKLDCFYPDLVLWVNGIGIDIEIDEPYTFESGMTKEIHYVLDYGGNASIDKSRDDSFVGKNWFVLRFSEEQIITHLSECIEAIRAIVNFITYKNERYLSDYNRIATRLAKPRWTKERARAMAKTNARMNYGS